MGCWGIGVFEGDIPYDMISELSDLAGRDLYFIKTLAEQTDLISALDSGLTEKVRAEIASRKYNTDGYKVFFAALVMNAGGKMSEEHKKEIVGIIGEEVGPMPGTKEFKEAGYGGLIMGEKQVVLALKEYKNDGEPYDFKNLGLMDMMSWGIDYRAEWEVYQWGRPFPPTIAKKNAEYAARKAKEAAVAGGDKEEGAEAGKAKGEGAGPSGGEGKKMERRRLCDFLSNTGAVLDLV